ncbi:KRAB-A domain-containing protein 2-like [Daktulosphaira vitifoliae]|uniref:KRAB-A domain-containing protein 2-like n=1 Tax=Daktulosphaira vitifoliae TaxID=58002 RepID=UPI0021AA3E10|nr:KRAB-A domain-containing protein 2-like [Daktulosphaira vitifoliae]
MTSREKFYECFYKIVNEKNNNSVYLSAVKYNEIVSEIKNVRSSGIKSNKAYRILKKYDLITIGEEDKLILPLLEGNTNILYYITNENIYDVLHDVHLSIGHGGKHRMNAEVKKKYKNITQEAVSISRSSKYIIWFLLLERLCIICTIYRSYKFTIIVIRIHYPQHTG